MKICITTMHSIPNFGSVFQTFALCEYLRKNGYPDTVVIDYNPSYYRPKTLRSTVGKLLNYKAYKVRSKKFRSFLEQNIPMTEYYATFEELKANPPKADVYIVGGDQLWNVYHTCGSDDAFKLTYVKGKKLSYGTSMGQTDFTKEQLRDLAKKINDFSAVAVRESSTVPLLESVGVKATHTVDPVFLLDAQDYERFLKPVNEERYLMVYLVTPSPLLDRCIEYLRKKYDLKVILCSGFSKKCDCDRFIKDIGPDEVLSYIKNAEIVLSSSFHATSFALMFKKQFFTILPDAHTNERIEDILRLCNLSERIITEESNLQELYKTIDYKKTDILSEQISNSKTYLKEALENVR